MPPRSRPCAGFSSGSQEAQGTSNCQLEHQHLHSCRTSSWGISTLRSRLRVQGSESHTLAMLTTYPFQPRSSKTLARIEALVIETCARQTSPVLLINEAKTARVSRRESRRVTGLVLTNDGKVSIGRELKRRIRAQMHYFATDRLDSESEPRTSGDARVHQLCRTLGVITRLRRKYGADVVRRCQEWSRE